MHRRPASSRCATGDHVATRAELEACCGKNVMAESWENVSPHGPSNLIIGIDWGGGGTSRTVVVIGYMRSDYSFEVCRFERFAATEDPLRVVAEVAKRCQQFRIRWIAADGGGNGHVLNRLLLDRLKNSCGLCAILYSATEHEPHQDGCLTKWTVNRSASIGVLYSRIKKQQMIFPRVDQCGSFLAEFAIELAEYDDITRTVRYTHPDGMQDDAVHATNYALIVALRTFSGGRRSIDDCS